MLADGRTVDFSYAMIVPSCLDQGVIRDTPGIADEKAYLRVRDTYQTEAHDDVYAVGIAAAVAVPWQTQAPVGIPKTGFPTERMAHVAARNIAAQVRGETPTSHETFGDMPAVCVMNAGNNGVIITSSPTRFSRGESTGSSSRPPGARYEARLREILPPEGAPRLRVAAVTEKVHGSPPSQAGGGVPDWLERRGTSPMSRALAVVAHPDDESFGLGAVIAALVDRGVEVHVLCLTRGEASTLGAADDLASLRADELRSAAAQIGVTDVTLLDYPDGRLETVGVDLLETEVEARIASVDFVVAFEPGGVTGHPDHQVASAAAGRVAARHHLLVLEWGVSAVVGAALDAELGQRFTTFDPGPAPISLQVDRTRQAAAIACHRSQSATNPVLARRLALQGDIELVRWRSPLSQPGEQTG